MVETQLKRRGIDSPKVLEAFLNVPRENFIPEKSRKYAYNDSPLPVGYGQTISQPYIVALMTQLLEIKKNDKVLEIGSGSGYQAAILSFIGARVFSVERIKELREIARSNCENAGFTDVAVVEGDGTLGFKEHAPFDAIIVTAGAPSVPELLKEQLVDGGRLVIPVGSSFLQDLLRIRKIKNKY
ncbi:MAG: protein-L-isoaspartate(D-aspartate) O-methyltransferase, partial [Candidatus Aureabacteria bacterium]|nr:protein-L-isoaspartate(D-aspartate) O-methyltransferase [Candidatus Auribacterota bacterium]